MSVLAPTGELLSFAWPKESNQRKGHPTAAYFMRRPFGLFPAKASVLGAADGKIKEH
jgi:hypothetical protein